jgi:hypothetical protein
MKRLLGCFARCWNSEAFQRAGRSAGRLAAIGAAAVAIAAVSLFAGPVAAKSPVIGRAAIIGALPDYPVPQSVTCRNGEVSFPVYGELRWDLLDALKRDVADAVSGGACHITLVLDSDGGFLIPTLNIVWFLQKLPAQVELTTLVPGGSMCNSACTLLFASGHRRVAAPDATFLFHPLQVTVKNPRLEPKVPAIESEMADYWIEAVRRADPWLAKVLARARVFGGSTNQAYLGAADLKEHAGGWVLELRGGCNAESLAGAPGCS